MADCLLRWADSSRRPHGYLRREHSQYVRVNPRGKTTWLWTATNVIIMNSRSQPE